MASKQKPYIPSERLKKCLAAGSVVNLFPILQGWPTKELKALLKDADAYYEYTSGTLDEAWGKLALEPGTFFHTKASAALDRARSHVGFSLLATCSEICSVAQCYLRERRKTHAGKKA